MASYSARFRETVQLIEATGDFPAFVSSFDGIHATSRALFGRNLTQANLADRIVFLLGGLCLEDFLEICGISAIGYGLGGIKILRSLYERVVTVSYISLKPETAQDFFDFMPVQMMKIHRRAKEVYGTSWGVSPETEKTLREWSERVKGRFEEVICEKCGTKRPTLSWSRNSLEALATYVEKMTKKSTKSAYLSAAQLPNLFIHSNLAGAGRVWKDMRTVSSDFSADQLNFRGAALSGAHALLCVLFDRQNQYFHLNLDQDIEERERDWYRAWHGYEMPSW
ncbi:MAG: DUF5677 domain-containing protein [Bryobacteraceae bacterium]